MLRLNISVPYAEEARLQEYAMRKIGGDIKRLIILKKALDARNKGRILYNFTVAVEIEQESRFLREGVTEYTLPVSDLEEICQGRSYQGERPLVVGSGPSGLFTALILAYVGARPIVIERGGCVEDRVRSVNGFFTDMSLNTESNVQFGEGGAGTFSDGKLNTGIGGEYIPMVLGEFIKHGAPEDIAYLAKPHIGTDRLVDVVRNMRRTIIERGGEVLFNTRLNDLIIKDGKIAGAVTSGGTIHTNTVFLAIGHSARDTFEMLHRKGVVMESKQFSMGVRIEHLQKNIGLAQYGKEYKNLPVADYKMAEHLPNGRSLYTFCMCPGGVVVNASSEEKAVCVNGMSDYVRGGENANSALLVNVGKEDWRSVHPLAGMEYQRALERRTYEATGGYKPPVQLYGDFIKRRVTKGIGEVVPSVATGYVFADLNGILPEFICDTIAVGVDAMARKIRGFNVHDAVLTGIEARSSSPVRILRDERYQSSVTGLIPIGEGAGYAGGITSAAVDGIKGAISVLVR